MILFVALIYSTHNMVGSATNCQGIVREIHSASTIVTLWCLLIDSTHLHWEWMVTRLMQICVKIVSVVIVRMCVRILFPKTSLKVYSTVLKWKKQKS